jgi:BCCT, betaine/carnitine/choline family transporter
VPLDQLLCAVGCICLRVCIFRLALYLLVVSCPALSCCNVTHHNFLYPFTGNEKSHWVQLCFWAVIIGALASVVLKAGGMSSLKSLQAFNMIMSLPLNFLALYAMHCIYQCCIKAEKSADKEDIKFHRGQQEFQTPVYGGIFNALEYMASLGRVHTDRMTKNMDQPTVFHVVEFCKGLLLPPWPMAQALQILFPMSYYSNIACIATYTAAQLFWLGIIISRKDELNRVSWAFFFLAGIMLAYIRNSFRERYGLRSNFVGDLVASTLLWLQVLMQMREESMTGDESSTLSDDEGSDEENIHQYNLHT